MRADQEHALVVQQLLEVTVPDERFEDRRRQSHEHVLVRFGVDLVEAQRDARGSGRIRAFARSGQDLYQTRPSGQSSTRINEAFAVITACIRLAGISSEV